MTSPGTAEKQIVVGLSGGSGAAYGRRLLDVLLRAGHRVHLVATGAALRVLKYEEGLDLTEANLAEIVAPELRDRLVLQANVAVESTPASGSARIDGVVICPCSMGTLARVAHGFSSNLLERAADVALKERRRLIVVPRETPLSAVHLRNMLLLAEAGATVLPAMPGFYQRPASVADLVDFIVARVLDCLGIEHELVRRWRTPEGSGTSDGSGSGAQSAWNEGEAD